MHYCLESETCVLRDNCLESIRLSWMFKADEGIAAPHHQRLRFVGDKGRSGIQ